MINFIAPKICYIVKWKSGEIVNKLLTNKKIVELSQKMW